MMIITVGSTIYIYYIYDCFSYFVFRCSVSFILSELVLIFFSRRALYLMCILLSIYLRVASFVAPYLRINTVKFLVSPAGPASSGVVWW